jgi:kumamolisin
MKENVTSKKTTIAGSEKKPIGTRVGNQPGDELIEVSVILKPGTRAAVPHAGGTSVSREEFAAKYGADTVAIEKVRKFAKEYNLKVGEISVERRTVKLEGMAADLTRAFGTSLHRYEHEGHQYRARTGGIALPHDLAAAVEAVLGLDNRPQAKRYYRLRPEKASGPAAVKGTSYSPRQIARLYRFPPDVTGSGQTIAILEQGGGYKPEDLKKYFSSLGIEQPQVISVSVDKAENAPINRALSADGEVMLDIEVAAAVAPGAKIVVYFAPNTSQGLHNALTAAIHDKTHKPTIISISWGHAECNWTVQSMTAFDSAAQDAAALGITICAAAGDHGSSDNVADGANHVDFPASSPHILACGGTTLRSADGNITSETVWNDGVKLGATGGGYSNLFALPAWQSSLRIQPPSGSGRGVPDVSGVADLKTGYKVLVDGKTLVLGGTSAVAPLWSALIALLNEKRGTQLGFPHPVLYAIPRTAAAFRGITAGSNGAFAAAAGWNPATGLGSPSGENLLNALSGGKRGRGAKA